MSHPLDPLLKPQTIALLGASERANSPGRVLAELVINSDFRGEIFPVNPRYQSILGRRCFTNLAALPKSVEHVVLAVANEHLEQSLRQAIAHGAKAATIYASCVQDNDTDPALKQRLHAIAAEAGMAVCGGNGMGFYNVAEQLYAGIFPLPKRLAAGGITLIAQSGSALSALVHNGVRLQFNLCVSTGNELTTSVADYMLWALAQSSTRVIALFLETVRDSAGFVQALEQAAASAVPVVMLRVGKSPRGAKMAVTHTGAIAGNQAAFEALAHKYPLIEVEDFAEMAATLQVFQASRRPGLGGLATIQESGGLMELATDTAHRLGVEFADIDASTKAEIQQYLEPGLRADNPLDAWGSNADFENRFYGCLSALMRDRNVAAGMFISNFRDDYYLSEAFYRVVEKVSKESTKPLAITNCYPDLAHSKLCERSVAAGIPFMDGTREGLMAMQHLLTQRSHHHYKKTSRAASTPCMAVRTWRSRLCNASSKILRETEALALLNDFSIDTPRVRQIDSEVALITAADEIGYPLVLKTAAHGMAHKSEYGGVVPDIRDQQSLLVAYRELCTRLGPAALVCERVAVGTELGLGMVNDPQFGPIIVLSAGGIYI